MSYIVTRQLQWSSGEAVVEISQGGWDYINPDALCEKYPGEFEEFKDPREAVKTAIAIATQWQKDEPAQKIGIGAGYTGGYTMPFESQGINELKKWAHEEYLLLPRCAQCGKILESDSPIFVEEFDEVFCSQSCVNRAYSAYYDEEECEDA